VEDEGRQLSHKREIAVATLVKVCGHDGGEVVGWGRAVLHPVGEAIPIPG